ncbi:MAG: hypothetical protein ACTSUN_08825 [Promethearchaeota archaeon]
MKILDEKEIRNVYFDLLKIINQKVIITQKNIIKKLSHYTPIELKNKLKELEKEDIVKKEKLFDNVIYSLTLKGKEILNRYLKNPANSNICNQGGGDILDTHDIIEKSLQIAHTQPEDLTDDTNIPSFIGCFIADKAGKSLLIFELYDGAIEEYLKIQNLGKFDKELIPMMMSALENFSREINIENLTSLTLDGANIKLQTYKYEKFTVTFLMNPRINFKAIKKIMNEYFKTLFSSYKKELEYSMEKGLINNIYHLNELGREMLKELNKFVYLAEFKKIINKLTSFDMAYAKTLYNKLDQLQNKLTFKFTKAIKKLKQLKVYLLKAMLDENLDELKFIINLAQQIESEFN